MANVVELRGVRKTYARPVPTEVLHGIDLAFAAGSFNSVVGTSGSGKSTLLNIMSTLDRPTEGSVMIDGQDTVALKPRQLARLRNRTIGFVFQFHHLLPEFTALENVVMPHRIATGSAGSAVRGKAEALMGRLGLDQVKDNPSSKLSGGQQQRTAIARALMNDPKVVFADEPTGNLDSETSAAIYRVLRQVNRDLGTTFVVVTHDRSIAAEADRIVEIRDGRVEVDVRP